MVIDASLLPLVCLPLSLHRNHLFSLFFYVLCFPLFHTYISHLI